MVAPVTSDQRVPQEIREWIVGMVNGRASVNVGHMMFSTKENFRTEPFEQGLNLLRTCGPVGRWLDEEGITAKERKSRLQEVREFSADAIRAAVIAAFDSAHYPGD